MRVRILSIPLMILILLGLTACSMANGPVASTPEVLKPATTSTLPAKKQTTLGLYVTAKEAFSRWHVNPDAVKILDVRTPEEYIFIGHAPMAYNIPLKFLTKAESMAVLISEKKKPMMENNPYFIEEARNRFQSTDTIMVYCRSGARSANAVNLLAENGFSNVYSITDGFEGDKVKDEASYFNGKRMKNGWKNAGTPWTYHLDPELMYLP